MCVWMLFFILFYFIYYYYYYNFRRSLGASRVCVGRPRQCGISLACIAFYLVQPQVTRNYGGARPACAGCFGLPRSGYWRCFLADDLFPLRRWTRGLSLVLLALSVLSVSYPTWNPWTHPWLMVFSQYLGWGYNQKYYDVSA